MSDLISRSALIDLFKNLRDEHETNSISYNALYEVILQQPIAYDKEAVVEQLEEQMNDAKNLWDDDEYYTGQANAYEYAIDIVKVGVKND